MMKKISEIYREVSLILERYPFMTLDLINTILSVMGAKNVYNSKSVLTQEQAELVYNYAMRMKIKNGKKGKKKHSQLKPEIERLVKIDILRKVGQRPNMSRINGVFNEYCNIYEPKVVANFLAQSFPEIFQKARNRAYSNDDKVNKNNAKGANVDSSSSSVSQQKTEDNTHKEEPKPVTEEKLPSVMEPVHVVEVPWSAIEFGIAVIYIYHVGEEGCIMKDKPPFEISCPVSRNNFNQIKIYVEKKLPQIKVMVQNGQIINVESISNLHLAVDMIKAEGNTHKVEPNPVTEEMLPSAMEPAHVVEIPWKAIEFRKGVIYIYHVDDDGSIMKNKAPFVVSCPVSRKSFNQIKIYFEKKLPQIKVMVQNGQIINVESNLNLRLAVNIINRRSGSSSWEIDESIPYGASSNLRAALRVDPLKLLQLLRKKKSVFLNYLINNQIDHRRIVPCEEAKVHTYFDGSDEEAFIFTIQSQSKGIEWLVFENENPARSTIVFEVESTHYQEGLLTVFDFFRSGEINKRLKLHHQSFRFPKNTILRYFIINHTDIQNWKKHLRGR